MAVLACKFPRTRLPVGASALCVVVLCWLYVFPVYRLPDEKEIVQGVLQQGTAWRRNRTAAGIFRSSCPRGSTPLVSFPPRGAEDRVTGEDCLAAALSSGSSYPPALSLSFPNLETVVRGPFPSP